MKDVLLFVVGVFVGGMNSIAGGGMLVGFPALLAAGLSPLTANVTGNLVVLPGQLTSAFGYRTYIKTLKRRYLLLLIPCLIGSAAGALVLSRTSSGEFERVVPGLITFAVVLFALQPYLHFHLHRHISRRSRNLQTLILIGIALLPIAFYGGYFGPGFGFIMLAFLGFTSLKDVHKMNALKNLAGSVIGVVSIICLLHTGLFNWHYGLVMAIGSALGGYSGSRLSQRVSSHTIRIIVIVIGLCAAIYLALKSSQL